MGERHLAPSTSSSEDDASEAESWIEWFCKQDGNEFFCEVDPRYIDDNFNLYGLREVIGVNFRKCMDVILDRTDGDDNLDHSVQDLYGLIHARFIVTKRGQDKMKRKFKNCEFGVCPLLSCQQQPVLPVGLKDQIDDHSVMVYCPRCNQVMLPSMRTGEDVDLDGAYFGTTFPHLFLMQFPELRPPPPVKMLPYVPRVFGFKVRLPQITHSTNQEQMNMSIDGSNMNNINMNNSHHNAGQNHMVMSVDELGNDGSLREREKLEMEEEALNEMKVEEGAAENI